MIQGAFRTFLPGGKFRHFGRKDVIDHIDFYEVPKSIFEDLGSFAVNHLKKLQKRKKKVALPNRNKMILLARASGRAT